MELELETATRDVPAPMPEASDEAEIKLCRIDDPNCEACQ